MIWRRLLVLMALLLLASVAAQAQESGPGYWEQTPLPQQGLATFYARGMMEYVHDYRLRQGDVASCAECVGTVALLRAGDIGRKVWLKPPAGDPVGPFLVVDCARRQDIQPLLDRNWVVDVSYETGQLWGMTRPLADVLVFEDPADAAKGAAQPDRLPTRFYVDPREVVISAPTATRGAESMLPTPWPTRLPVVLPGVTVAPADVSVATPVPSVVTPGPPPLTPVITTPTVEPVQTAPSPPLPPTVEVTMATEATPAVSSGQGLLEAAGEVAMTTPEPEISIGRAGGGILGGDDPAATLFLSGLSAPTRVRAARTPRPGLTPILPVRSPTPAPAPGEGEIESFWERVLREIWELIR